MAYSSADSRHRAQRMYPARRAAALAWLSASPRSCRAQLWQYWLEPVAGRPWGFGEGVRRAVMVRRPA